MSRWRKRPEITTDQKVCGSGFSEREATLSASMSLALDRGYEPPRNSEVANSYSARPAAARWRSRSLLSWNGSLIPRLWFRDHAGLKKMRL